MGIQSRKVCIYVMMYPRMIEQKIHACVDSVNAAVLVGPRLVGKTTLVKEVLKEKDYVFVNGMILVLSHTFPFCFSPCTSLLIEGKFHN